MHRETEPKYSNSNSSVKLSFVKIAQTKKAFIAVCISVDF